MPVEDETKLPRPNWVLLVLGALDIAKAALWPMLALIAFISLYAPLWQILDNLPDVIGRADVVTIGQLQLKLSRALAIQAPTALRAALRDISGDSLSRLIQLPPSLVACQQTHYEQEYAANRRTDEDLSQRQLARVGDYPANDSAEMKNCYLVERSELGNQTRTFIVRVMVSAVNRGIDAPAAPGSVAPAGSAAPGSVAPGSVAPGSVAPGSVAPGGGAPAAR